jgi:hypothetical protein
MMREAEERTNKTINFLKEEGGLILGGAGKDEGAVLGFLEKIQDVTICSEKGGECNAS